MGRSTGVDLLVLLGGRRVPRICDDYVTRAKSEDYDCAAARDKEIKLTTVGEPATLASTVDVIAIATV